MIRPSIIEQLAASATVDDILLELLNDEHDTDQAVGDWGLGEEVEDLRLQHAGTQRQLGDIRSDLSVNSLEVENCHLVIIDNCLVSHIVGPALIVVQDTQSLATLSVIESVNHLATIDYFSSEIQDNS